MVLNPPAKSTSSVPSRRRAASLAMTMRPSASVRAAPSCIWAKTVESLNFSSRREENRRALSMATAAWEAKASKASRSASSKAPPRLLMASTTPKRRPLSRMGTARMERVTNPDFSSILGDQRGSLRTSLRTSDLRVCATVPAMP